MLFSLMATAQSTKKKSPKFLRSATDKEIFEKAEQLFDERNYLLALPLYTKLEQGFPNELVLKYKVAACMLYKTEEQANALDRLRVLDAHKLRKTDYYFFLGLAYHLNYKFDEAVEYLNVYLEGKRAPEQVQAAQALLLNCRHGKELLAKPVAVKVQNIGAPVNTAGAEYVPVISSDESVLIFTYRGERSTGGKRNLANEPDPDGEYNEDVFISHKLRSSWSPPVSIGESINSDNHDAAIALSNDGQKLFIYKNTMFNDGDIYMSSLEGKEWSQPMWLKGDVNSLYWEGSVSLSSNERLIYFSSDRPGGYGGRDIYSAVLMPDGTWGKVKNLGPRINTPYDDDAPSIHPDGRLFHFSSKGHNSMGGYDVFRTVLEIDSTWREPENLGYPINTTGDDIYYVVAGDGEQGYYSSAKPGGNGLHDIYTVEPGVPGMSTRVLEVKGTVTLDDEPAGAVIEVKYQGEDKVLAEYSSNVTTGNYLINLPAGKKYTLVYRMNQMMMKKDIDATDIEAYIGTVEDKRFFTNSFRKLSMMNDSLVAMEEVLSPELKINMNDVLKLFGQTSVKGLVFTVQIGAYSMPDNFRYGKLKNLGKIEVSKLGDGISRFTIGRFSTIAEANAHRLKIIEAGVKDAFVIAVYNDSKRIPIDQLVRNNFHVL